MIKNYMMMFVLIIPVQVFCSYPTEQEAEMLFSSNVLNKVDRINNSQYETFLMRMKRPATMETRKIVESKVLNGIMSINVSVSTNCNFLKVWLSIFPYLTLLISFINKNSLFFNKNLASFSFLFVVLQFLVYHLVY